MLSKSNVLIYISSYPFCAIAVQLCRRNIEVNSNDERSTAKNLIRIFLQAINGAIYNV